MARVSEAIDPRVRELLSGPNYAHVATIGRDGMPQTTAVWIRDDGDLVAFYKEATSVALANLRRDPRLSVSMIAFDDPYLGCTIWGRAVAFESGSDAQRWLRDRAFEYTGGDYPADQMPAAGVLIKFEVERQSWHHFDRMAHREDRPTGRRRRRP